MQVTHAAFIPYSLAAATLQDRTLAYTFAFASSSIGIVDFITWLVIQRRPLARAWAERNRNVDAFSDIPMGIGLNKVVNRIGRTKVIEISDSLR